MAIDKDKLLEYFRSIEKMKSEDLMKMVEKYMDDDTIELFVDHIEDFYGIQDDDELGILTQIMIAGFVCAKEIS